MRLAATIDINNALDKLNLNKNGVKPAVARALNKTVVTGRAEGARAIQAAGYNMKAGDIKRALRADQRATRANLNAQITASGQPIPLIQFAARPTGSGVSVNVKNGRKIIPHVFIAVMPGSGHRGVFERVGNAHKRVTKAGKRYTSGLPIKELYGPSIKAAFGSAQVIQQVSTVMRERFPVVLVQELKFEALR